jgi:hypothetical protein
MGATDGHGYERRSDSKSLQSYTLARANHLATVFCSAQYIICIFSHIEDRDHAICTPKMQLTHRTHSRGIALSKRASALGSSFDMVSLRNMPMICLSMTSKTSTNRTPSLSDTAHSFLPSQGSMISKPRSNYRKIILRPIAGVDVAYIALQRLCSSGCSSAPALFLRLTR